MKAKIVLLVAAFTAVAALLAFALKPAKQHRREYARLMEKAQSNYVDHTQRDPFVASQRRLGVRKHIFFTKGSDRLEICADSDSSDLIFDHHENSTDAREILHHLRCHLQEELYYTLPGGDEVVAGDDGAYYLRNDRTTRVDPEAEALQPMQLVRYVEAEEAVHDMTHETIVAQKAEVYQYRALGHTLEEATDMSKPLMRGVADEVTVTVGKDGVKVDAKGLKGKMLFPFGGGSGA